MGQSLDFILDSLKKGKFDVKDLPLSDETAGKMENVQRAEDAETIKNQKTEKSGIFREIERSAKSSHWAIKSVIFLGLATLAYHKLYVPANNAITSAAADPAHYSANPFSSKFWNNKGDENAPVTDEYAKQWLENKIQPLHSKVKEELAPDLDKALSDKKLTLKETADLSNKISDLNHKFFGTEFPDANAVPIVPKKPKI